MEPCGIHTIHQLENNIETLKDANIKRKPLKRFVQHTVVPDFFSQTAYKYCCNENNHQKTNNRLYAMQARYFTKRKKSSLHQFNAIDGNNNKDRQTKTGVGNDPIREPPPLMNNNYYHNCSLTESWTGKDFIRLPSSTLSLENEKFSTFAFESEINIATSTPTKTTTDKSLSTSISNNFHQKTERLQVKKRRHRIWSSKQSQHRKTTSTSNNIISTSKSYSQLESSSSIEMSSLSSSIAQTTQYVINKCLLTAYYLAVSIRFIADIVVTTTILPIFRIKYSRLYGLNKYSWMFFVIYLNLFANCKYFIIIIIILFIYFFKTITKLFCVL